MPTYLMREALSPTAWQDILEGRMDPHPLSDPDTMAAGFTTVGGTLHGLWLSAENSELVFVVDLPSTVDAVSCSLRYLQRGGYGPVRVTPLLTPAEGTEAVRRAATLPRSYTVRGSDR